MATMVKDQAIGTRQTIIEPQADLRCAPAAWNVEVHTFYGAADSVAAKIGELQNNLNDLRAYVVAVDGNEVSTARLIERRTLDDESCTVMEWSGSPDTDLGGLINTAILENRGLHCSGEQVKAALRKTVDLHAVGTAPAPA